MSSGAAFWSVLALAVVGGAVVGVLIWLGTAAQRRAEELEIGALRADLLREAGHRGWVESDPPAELTWRGLGTVIPDEKRRCALVGTHAGRQVALLWCSFEDNDVSLRYVALLVRVDGQLPGVEIQLRRSLTVVPHGAPDAVGRALTGPVRAALHRLRDLGSCSDRPVRIEGRALQVVVDGWPRLPELGAHLTAATTLAAALSTADTATDDGPDI
ncbi:hypothetical protein O7608_30450 [Solwaraspora sp. WMMA2056]|uniref:hypothetical protein n=1 Tax=Solwaraspora sp. WMMA2056 TaxID=3015161 RepID=UPI00259B0899|nr:hypothetical protein [Solwaraspora sp. WMMA2056]WJK40660.1 hypothetical protein O7608_30450 [Solwaraspora sp. WMMA2056]